MISAVWTDAAIDGSEMQSPDAKDSDQTDNNQIDGDDEVEQAGHDENKNPGDQRNQRSKTQIDVHGKPFVSVQMASMAKQKTAPIKAIRAMETIAAAFTRVHSSVLSSVMQESGFCEEHLYAINDSGSVRLPT